MNPPSAEATRDRILAEAERLFRHYGYSKTTVADIASACEMSAANVYRFFPSKLAINEAICGRFLKEIQNLASAIAYRDAPASARLRDYIVTLNEWTARNLTDEKKVHEMVTVALDEHWEAIRCHLEFLSGLLFHIIESGVKAGEFKEQDITFATRCVFASLAAFNHPALVAQCPFEDRPSPDEMAAFIINALKA